MSTHGTPVGGAPAVIIPEQVAHILNTLGELKDDLKAEREAAAAERGEISGLKENILAQERKITELESRARWLDEHQPRGQKTWVSNPFDPNEVRENALKNFGRCFTAASMVAEGKEPPAGFERGSIKDAEKRTGQIGATDTAGGVFVPTEVLNDVIRVIKETSIARQLARVVPMAENEMEIPTVVTGATASFLDEVTDATESDVAFASKADSRMTAEECVVFGAISRRLRGDALSAFEPVLAELYGEAHAAKENASLFSMTTPFTGIVQVVGTAGNARVLGGSTTSGMTHYSVTTMDDIVLALNGLQAGCRGNAQWVMHPDLFPYFMLIEDGNGNKIYGTNWADGFVNYPVPAPITAAPARLLGKPCWFSEQISGTNAVTKVVAIVGDFRKAIFGDRQQMILEIDDSVLFRKRQRAVMMSQRFATKVYIASAFGGLKTATS